MFTINQPSCLEFASDFGWQELKDFFSVPRNVLIVSHKNPDGDAVGSALGLQWILKELNHTVQVALPDNSPGFLKWLPGHDEIIIWNRKRGKDIGMILDHSDAVFYVDFNAMDRLGGMEPLFCDFSGLKILIDHHPDGNSFTQIRFVDTSKSSTSEMIYYWIQKMGFIPLMSPEAATCLLAGIMTDTVGFKVSCSYPEFFVTVARLMESGADKDRIYNEVYNNFSLNRMRLLGYSLEKKMTVLEDYQTAYISLDRRELNFYDHKKGDTEGFVNYPLSLSGIDFSVLFTEQEDEIKLSLRSKASFPANEFAKKYFSGGGHLNASGGRFNGTLEQAVNHFICSLKDFRESFFSKG